MSVPHSTTPYLPPAQPPDPPQKRIKRQRRKLRGKYSGDCASCAAKWSKCWYIASVDNQIEWETKLGILIRPCDNEVCFQCWDGKIRTSPKRRQPKFDETNLATILSKSGKDTHVGLESPLLDLKADMDGLYKSTEDMSPRTSNKRALPDDIIIPLRESSLSQPELSPMDTHQDNEGDRDVMPEEHEAVLLLSTAFKTFPLSPNVPNYSFLSQLFVPPLHTTVPALGLEACRVTI